jgi:hypothetical protein
MTFKRWLPTFVAFPLGGLLAFVLAGSLDDPLSGAVGGLLAGAVIGAGQWLALRSHGIGRRWVVHTAVAMAAGTALAAAVTGAGTELGDLMLTGLVAGAAVGAAQSTLLGRGRLASVAWTAVTAATWPLGWLATWAVVGLNADLGFYVFGSSGAVLVTVLTGLAIRRILAAPLATSAMSASGATSAVARPAGATSGV